MASLFKTMTLERRHARRRAASCCRCPASSAPTRPTARSSSPATAATGPYVQKGKDNRSHRHRGAAVHRSRSTRRWRCWPSPSSSGAGRAPKPPLRELGDDPVQRAAGRGQGRPLRRLRHRRRDQRVAAQGRPLEEITPERAAELLAERREAGPTQEGGEEGPRQEGAAKKTAAATGEEGRGEEGARQEEGAGEEGTPISRRRVTEDRRPYGVPSNSLTARWASRARALWRRAPRTRLDDDVPTDPFPPIAALRCRRMAHVRVFGSRAFFRLWLAQVVSSLGDWIGFLADRRARQRIGGSSPEAAIGLVMSARLIPGFFLAPVRGRARRPLGPQEGHGRAATSAAASCSRRCRSSTPCGGWSSPRSSSRSARCCGRRRRKRRCRTSCRPIS